MQEVLTVMAPIFAFMLIPVWIPLATTSVGFLADLLSARREEVSDGRLPQQPKHALRAAAEGGAL